MATRINGNSLQLFAGIGATRAATTTGADGERIPFAHANSVSLDFSNSIIDVTTKSSNSWREIISGQKSYTVSADGLLDNFADSSTTTRNTDDINMYAVAGTTIYFEFGVGNARFQGSGVISSLSQSGGTDDSASYSITIEGNGTLVWDADVTS